MLIKKIPDASGLGTTTVLNTKISEVENKIPNTSGLVATNVLNTKIREVENKISNHDKYIATPEFNKLTAESFAASLKQADLVNKTDIDKKLTNINKKITSNKTKHTETDKKLTDLTKNVAQISEKGYDFLLGRMYFTDDDDYQNFLVFAPMLSSLILYSNRKVTD